MACSREQECVVSYSLSTSALTMDTSIRQFASRRVSTCIDEGVFALTFLQTQRTSPDTRRDEQRRLLDGRLLPGDNARPRRIYVEVSKSCQCNSLALRVARRGRSRRTTVVQPTHTHIMFTREIIQDDGEGARVVDEHPRRKLSGSQPDW